MTAGLHVRPSPLRHRGFTLIEILVVVVIIAVLSSLVLLSVGVVHDDRDVDTEVRRMASLIELAADEAVLQGRDFGVEFLLAGYRFVELDPLLGRWNEVVGDDLLRPRRLPEDMEFDVLIEGRRIRLAREAAAATKDGKEQGSGLAKNYAPHALILSSGDLTPLELTLVRRTDDLSQRLRIVPGGDIKIGEDDDEMQ
ncbi:MAG: type II secretion system minor pseudopilin GspH [Gammaproteobacteria bacterium]|nr:type II secretion system minor pseudopilin GspH [Gammaproteobacteria bacterium]MDH4253886.1 type II secretion system minor pseudopilin GspH [Gammaproteobacteria bacterium]MDH5309801.1 type II secretion system minor pseudopilin GspH [Gammaproteobacteria bacterium]